MILSTLEQKELIFLINNLPINHSVAQRYETLGLMKKHPYRYQWKLTVEGEDVDTETLYEMYKKLVEGRWE